MQCPHPLELFFFYLSLCSCLYLWVTGRSILGGVLCPCPLVSSQFSQSVNPHIWLCWGRGSLDPFPHPKKLHVKNKVKSGAWGHNVSFDPELVLLGGMNGWQAFPVHPWLERQPLVTGAQLMGLLHLEGGRAPSALYLFWGWVWQCKSSTSLQIHSQS